MFANVYGETTCGIDGVKIKNTLIVSPPMCGKTTMLRDLAFQLSSGRMGKYHKT